MPTTVANIRDGIPPNSVYIGRAGRGFDGRWGNPFMLSTLARDDAIARYREWFTARVSNDEMFRQTVIRELRDKTLLCFCKPLACHGDVIKEFLDGN